MAVNKKDVEKIIAAIGGSENIEVATHCVTRLRLVLQDEKKVDQKALEANDLVKGHFSTQGQFQVIIGPGIVDQVYEELIAITGNKREGKEAAKSAGIKHVNPLQQLVQTLANIFIPLLPALVTAGLLLGVNNLLTGPDIFFSGQSLVDVYPQWKDVADIINTIASTAFAFLPALIGWSAVSRFGGSPLLGIVLGLILVHPNLLSAYSYAAAKVDGTIPVWNLFGWSVEKIGYQGQVLPVLASAYILAIIEKWLNRKVKDSIKLLVVAPIALLVTGFLAYTLIGPVTFTIANWITDGLVSVFANVPWLGGMIYGGLYALLVVTGLHQTFLAVDLQLINSAGGTFLWPMLALSNIAQGAAALAMMFVVKNQKTKSLAGTTSISAFLGITEPAIFGVNLRYKYPLFFGMFGSAIGGVLLSVTNVKAFAIGVGGIPGFLAILPKDWSIFFIGMAIVLVVPFTGTMLYGKIVTRNDKSSDETSTEDSNAVETESPVHVISNNESAGLSVLEMTSPVAGEAVLLENVPDPAFAEKQMGSGIAVEPVEGKVTAPFDATVVHIAKKSKHAVMLQHASGVQILIHVGINTVGLKGEGFTTHVSIGDEVKAGQLLVEFDPQVIKAAGLPMITPIIVPDGQEVIDHVEEIPGDAQPGQNPILRIFLK
jgi:PTS system trehalose-specific IIC component